MIAECGGFMYLHQQIADGQRQYPMVGVFPGTAQLSNKLQNFGYITLTAQKDGLLCSSGSQLRAHEFHYSVSDNTGNAFYAEKPNGKSWRCAHMTDHFYAGYPHLYFGHALAERFVRKCANYEVEK